MNAVETGSTLGEPGSRVSGSRKTQAAMPIAAIGTLTRKTEPHQTWLSSQPPMIGPSGRPSAEAAETMAVALGCSSRVKSVGRTESASGVTRAAPTPISARAAMTQCTSPARAPTSEPARKTPSPAISIRRRPKRSPSSPAGSISAANTITYASAIHCCSPVEAPRSAAMVGSATLRIVVSKPRVSMLVTSAARAHQRRGSEVEASMK